MGNKNVETKMTITVVPMQSLLGCTFHTIAFSLCKKMNEDVVFNVIKYIESKTQICKFCWIGVSI